jgi:hypothetical protein
MSKSGFKTRKKKGLGDPSRSKSNSNEEIASVSKDCIRGEACNQSATGSRFSCPRIEKGLNLCRLASSKTYRRPGSQQMENL